MSKQWIRSSCWSCRNKNLTGELNPFFGKNHSESTKLKMRNADHTYKRGEQFKEAVKQGMVGKICGGDIRRHWALLSKEAAEEKMASFKRKLSESSRGYHNPMFGKPAPAGSGNGWSGWYTGWYFRSLLELSYVITVLEPLSLKWVSAESSAHDVTI